jgi:3-oxoacyl-[acyl-carrier-protein] synthase II
MKNKVAITGIGVVSPVGTGKEKFWHNLAGGISGIGPVQSFDCTPFTVKIGAEVKDFDATEFMSSAEAAECGKYLRYALAAARMALADAGLQESSLSGQKAALAIGTTMGDQSVERGAIEAQVDSGNWDEVKASEISGIRHCTITSYIAAKFGLAGPQILFNNACAAGNYSLGWAADQIRDGVVPVVIAGGVDVFALTAFAGFHRLFSLAPDNCRPFDKDRKGLVLGEGAGILILEDMERAWKRGARIYAEFAGYGLGMDAYHITSPDPGGGGAVRCMLEALQRSGLSSRDIDYISAHGTGTPSNDKYESFAVKQVFKEKIPPMSSIKSMLGHSLGAASALEAAACCLMMEENLMAPTINYRTPDEECLIDCVPDQARPKELRHVMSNAFAFGGNTASIILSKVSKKGLY